MSFVEAFYTFQVELTNADSGRFAQFRLKTPRHPYESERFFYARMLTFLHANEDGLAFSRGLYEPDQPAIWKLNEIEELVTWIEVGACEERKLKRALKAAERQRTPMRFAVYFYEPEHVAALCHALRGSRTNWVEHVHFFSIASETIDAIAEHGRTSARWTATLSDNQLFLSCDGLDFEVSFSPLDIWQEFQRSIANES